MAEQPEPERLQKLLARAGFGSRRACEELISAGRVTIDGEVARLGNRADPKAHRIELDGVAVVVNEDLVYYLLNKPVGVIATASDPQGRTTVLDLVPADPRVFSVGRLDNDTSGLLVLTNDGELTQLLTHPSHGVVKTYLAEVEGVPTPARSRRSATEWSSTTASPRRRAYASCNAAMRVRPSSSASTRAGTARCDACSKQSAIR